MPDTRVQRIAVLVQQQEAAKREASGILSAQSETWKRANAQYSVAVQKAAAERDDPTAAHNVAYRAEKEAARVVLAQHEAIYIEAIAASNAAEKKADEEFSRASATIS